MFKFRKFKEGYEDEKCEVSPRYSLDIGSFLMGEGQSPPESSAAPSAEVETPLKVASSDKAPLWPSFPQPAPDARQVSGASSVSVGESSLNISSSDGTPLVSLPLPAVPGAGQVFGTAPGKQLFWFSLPRPLAKAK